MLKGQAKRDYQREYMKRKRGLTKGSNIGLTRGSNKGSNLFSVDLLDPSLYDIPIVVTPKGPKGPSKGLPKGPRGLRPAPKPGEIPPTLEVLKQKYDVRSKLIGSLFLSG